MNLENGPETGGAAQSAVSVKIVSQLGVWCNRVAAGPSQEIYSPGDFVSGNWVSGDRPVRRYRSSLPRPFVISIYLQYPPVLSPNSFVHLFVQLQHSPSNQPFAVLTRGAGSFAKRNICLHCFNRKCLSFRPKIIERYRTSDTNDNVEIPFCKRICLFKCL